MCFCIHWVMQNTRQHFWLIHANSVDTVCVLFNSSFPCSRVCKSSTSCFLDKFLHTAPKVNLTKLTLHFTLCLCFSMSLVKSLSHTVDLLQQDFASVQSHTCINTWLPVPFACAERRTSGASQFCKPYSGLAATGLSLCAIAYFILVLTRVCMCPLPVQQGVPVVQVKYGSFGDTVDMLHQYILTCITTAMEWMQEDEFQHLQPPPTASTN